MDWLNWAGTFASTLVGAAIGGFAAYFVALNTEYGKNRAQFRDRDFVTGLAKAVAYEQEAGKRLATRDDIDNVLAQIKLVTKETELIKAQVSSDLWVKQAVWNQKRDAYFKIVKLAHALRSEIIELGSHNTFPDINQPEPMASLNKSIEGLKDLVYQFSDALTEAQIMAGKEFASWWTSGASLVVATNQILPNGGKLPADDLVRQQAFKIIMWVDNFSSFVRKDLGVI
jgi:hypothetical protein